MYLLHQVTREVASEIFHFVWRIRSIVEEETTKLKRLSELKTLLEQQKNPITLIENSIKRALQILSNELRKRKEKGAGKVITFVSTHNPNNPNIFPIIRQIFENFQHSKTMSNIFSGNKSNKLYA